MLLMRLSSDQVSDVLRESVIVRVKVRFDYYSYSIITRNLNN